MVFRNQHGVGHRTDLFPRFVVAKTKVAREVPPNKATTQDQQREPTNAGRNDNRQQQKLPTDDRTETQEGPKTINKPSGNTATTNQSKNNTTTKILELPSSVRVTTTSLTNMSGALKMKNTCANNER